MTYYGIYKITNLLNGKMYIGQHTTTNIDDGYMGSGLWIQRAIKKYGKENFRKEWLMFCEDEEELNYMERVYVDQTWVDRSDTYNLNLGGNYHHISEQGRKKIGLSKKGKPRSEKTKAILRIKCKGWKHTQEAKQKMSKSRTGLKQSEESKLKISKGHKGKKLSEEHRKKLSDSHKGYVHTESQRKKISESVRKAWNRKRKQQ